MQTIEEFMRCYFVRRNERFLSWIPNCASFRAKYFTEDFLAKYKKIWDEELQRQSQAKMAVLSIEPNELSAEVITSEFETWSIEPARFRYHLLATETGWRIDKRGRECWKCKGAGRLDDDACCSHCSGTGWRYSGLSRR